MATTPARAARREPARLEALKAAVSFLADNQAYLLRPVPDRVALIKRAAELATLADLAAGMELRRVAPEAAAAIDELCGLAWTALGRGDLLVGLIERDPRFVALAAAYVPFQRRGLENARLHAILARHAAAAADAHGLPRVATAMALRALTIPSPALDAAALVDECWVARTGEFEAIDTTRAYETTHIALWLSWLGPVPEPIRSRIASFVPRWLELFLDRCDVDVAAELAMASHLVGGSCVGASAWGRLLSRQLSDGSFLPTPVAGTAHLMGRFHPTLVNAIALTCCLASCPSGHDVMRLRAL